MARRSASISAVAALVLALAGCGGSSGPLSKEAGAVPAPTVSTSPRGGDGLRTFAGCADLVEHARDLARPYVTENGFGNGVGGRRLGGGWAAPREDAVTLGGPPHDPGVLMRPSDGDRTSLTPGRDNRFTSAATNGSLLVTVGARGLGVTDVSGKSPVARGALGADLGGFSAYAILLGQRRALVIGVPTAVSDGREHGLGIGVVDLNDPDHPRLESAEVVTGSIASLSIAGDVARVAVRSSPYLAFHAPTGENDRSALERNRAVIEQAPVSDWLPSARILDRAGRLGPAGPLIPCAAVRHPAQDSGLAFLSILSFDLSRPDALKSAGATSVLADTDLVYAVPESIYVATYPGAWGRAPVGRSYQATVARTVLHQFEAATGPVRYAASGGVAGWIPGEWGLSQEKDGLLAFVDTGRITGSTVRRSIVLMHRQDARLRETRRYSDVDQEGYNVGWFGPIAGIALGRDPAVGIVRIAGRSGPASRATVDVPGYSDLLAAPDRDHVIAVGEGPDAGGALKLSAFDIGDLANPRRTDLLALEPGSRSDAEDDASRARYLPGQRNLVLPVHLPVGKGWRRALVGVHVAKDGTLSEAGRWLAHSSPKRSRDSDYVEVLSLPDGRLVALERTRVTVLSGRDLSVHGSTAYPVP